MYIYYLNAYGIENCVELMSGTFISFHNGKALFMDSDSVQYAVPIESVLEIVDKYYTD